MDELLSRCGVTIGPDRKIRLRDEGTASAHVYDDHIHDFGSGEHLDAISFVGLQLFGDPHPKGEQFWKCLEWIADEARLPRPRRDPEAQARHERVQSVSVVYAAVMHDARKNFKPAHKYLEGRGISRETIAELVGYLPPNYQPPDPEAAKRAGLYSHRGNFLFSERLIIPIMHHGQIVSLYGRVLDDKRIPKHVYPGTTDPPMPPALWNLDACRGEREIIMVESIICALTLIDRKFPHVVAAFGTNGLTDARVELLKGTKIEQIILVYDTDINKYESGQKGALKAGEKLFRAGYEVQIISLPLDDDAEKSDPNSYFQDHSAEDFRALRRRDFFDVLLDTVSADGSPGEQYRAVEPILALVSEQPELTWKGYAAQIHRRLPPFDQRKLEKSIAEVHGSGEKERAGQQKFLPLEFVEQIRAEAPVICFDGRAYRYGDGVYTSWYPEEIDQKTIELYGPEVQTRHLDAVRKTLTSVCFVRPELVNPRGNLNLKNGILGLSNSDFREHSPDFLSTIQTATAFDPDAQCTLWLKTLEEIFPDVQLRLLLAQIFGYCLTPDISQQKAFIYVGDGGNGKSVVTDVQEAVCGPDNCAALHLSDFKERFRLPELQGRLVNFSTEVEAKGLINDARIKAVITGDPVTAERKNRDPFVFRPQVKLIVSCNHLPQTTDRSGGYFRRWIIVPFNEVFVGKKRDQHRAQTIIETELSGVLNWAIGGYKSLLDAGSFLEPAVSKAALSEYRRQTDHTIDFAEECLSVLRDEGGTPLQEIYECYRRWAPSNGYEALGRYNLNKALSRTLGVELLKVRDKGRFLKGVYLR
jgi:putative DNA primase/helicase